VHSSPASSRLNDVTADLDGLVRFVERRNLVSARVPSHFKRSLIEFETGGTRSNSVENCL
jgi:hypothetical protein